jgi:hypothetical protein
MPNPRKPDALKRLQGTFRNDRADPGRLEVEPCRIPSAPKGIAEDERQVWNSLRRVLGPLGIVGETDLVSFGLMVHAVVRSRRLAAVGDADPKVVMAASKEARSWLREFGLTPSSRSTVRTAAGEGAAETLDDLLN